MRASFFTVCLCMMYLAQICTAQDASPPPPASESVKITVSGEVKQPGIYTLQRSANIADAIKAAGGFGMLAGRVGVKRNDAHGRPYQVFYCRPSQVDRGTFNGVTLLDEDVVSVVVVY